MLKKILLPLFFTVFVCNASAEVHPNAIAVRDHLISGDVRRANRIIKRLYKKGSPEAMAAVGDMLSSGVMAGYDASHDMKNGSSQAINRLLALQDRLVYDSKVRTFAEEHAERLLISAANEDDPNALVSLAGLYGPDGPLGHYDPKHYRKWLTRAVESDHPLAIPLLKELDDRESRLRAEEPHEYFLDSHHRPVTIDRDDRSSAIASQFLIATATRIANNVCAARDKCSSGGSMKGRGFN